MAFESRPSPPTPLSLSSPQFLDLSAWSLMPFLSSSRWLLFSLLLISPCLTSSVAATLAMNPLIPLICSDFLLSTASVSLPNTSSFAQGLYCIKQKIYGFQIWQSKTPHPFVSSPDILLPTSRTILVDQLNRTWNLTPVLCYLQPYLWTYCITSLCPTLSPESRRLQQHLLHWIFGIVQASNAVTATCWMCSTH